ncbi:MAG: insulinase family protein [Oscillospiraceae bacterium]|nr:insulinase family protein [Oscillospiraceae bacterium]
MELSRTELLNGVFLNYLHSEKFKTACLSVNLLTQLKRETASMNALLPYVLRRGTGRYPDMEALSERMDGLYGTVVEPVVRRIGEVQCLGFYASFPESAFLPGREDVLRPTCELLGELLLNPATRGGLLLSAYVDSEREKLLNVLRSRINDKRSYAVLRCVEEMCCFEDFSAGRLGSESELKNVRYQKLSKHYRNLLQASPVEIFYCGRASKRQVADCLLDVLSMLPRGEIDWDIGTDLRMNALEDKPREVEEKLEVTQGKLVLGFRLGACMEDPDPAALLVFNGVFGGSSRSKLFMNVRERMQLCYDVGSLVDPNKGLLLAAAGIDFDKKQETQDEILRQLEAIGRGEISDEELDAARAGAAADLRMTEDAPVGLEDFTLTQTVSGLELSPSELAALCEEVKREDVAEIARGVECDLIYFLTGGGEAEPEDGEEDDAEPEL